MRRHHNHSVRSETRNGPDLRSPLVIAGTWAARIGAPVVVLALAVTGFTAPAYADDAPAADQAAAAAPADRAAPAPADPAAAPADPAPADPAPAAEPAPAADPAPAAVPDPAPEAAPTPTTAPDTAPSTVPAPAASGAPAAPASPTPSSLSAPQAVVAASPTATLTIVKHIEDSSGRLIDATPPGWAFTADSSALTPSPQTLTTGDATGAVIFGLAVPTGTPASVTVTETQHAGYELVPQDGANAVCTYANGAVVNAGSLGFTLQVAAGMSVRCVVINKPITLVPHWTLAKTSDPVSGSVVNPGQTITYTLSATNDSGAPVTGATATDAMGAVLDHAALSGVLPASLALAGSVATWQVPTLAPGETRSVSFSVVVDADAAGVTIDNVVTPGAGGSCPPYSPPQYPGCETTHRVPVVNLDIVKTHSTGDGGPGGVVDSGKGDLIDYTLTVGNEGPDAATGVSVSDPLPAGVTYVVGSLVGPAGWTGSVSGGVLTIAFTGSLAMGDSVALHFQATVGTLTRPGNDSPYPDLDNRACVTSTENDSDTSDNCSTDTTKVKAIAVSAQSLCVNDALVVSYSLTPFNITSTPAIAIIWWTSNGYAGRDPGIPAADEAALLADGAQQVDYVALPAGWMNGQTISGTQLWPGASVDASGHGNGWPGWRQLGDGTWVLDPAAPFYNLRDDAVVEVRINPTTASTVAYPPASTHCTPPSVTTTTTTGTTTIGLAATGSDAWGPGLAALALIGLGAAFLFRMRRRSGDLR
jgi:uncharacterized repeat protein (TIGR01451 family)